MVQRRLLTVAGVLECLTGLAFLLPPGITIAFLIGAEPGSVGLMIGRVAGVPRGSRRPIVAAMRLRSHRIPGQPAVDSPRFVQAPGEVLRTQGQQA